MGVKFKKLLSILIACMMIIPTAVCPSAASAYAQSRILSVAEAIAGNTGTATVQGYIVGVIEAPDKYDQQSPFGIHTNLVIADDKDETNPQKFLSVQLSKGELRNTLNLKENESNFKAKVELEGSLKKYYGIAGMKSIKKFSIIDETPSNMVKRVSANPASGEYALGTSIELSTGTEGAKIYACVYGGVYSGDSSKLSFEEYTKPFVFSEQYEKDSMTIYAKAEKKGMQDSEISSFTYSKKPETKESKIADVKKDYQKNKTVKVRGVVNGIIKGKPYIQDDTSGIRIDLNGKAKYLKLNDEITAEGKVVVSYGEYFISLEQKPQTLRSGVEVKAFEVDGKTDLEDYHGRYVNASDLQVDSVDKYGNFKTHDENGTVTVNTNKQYLEAGKTYETIEGIVVLNYSEYKIFTRQRSDIRRSFDMSYSAIAYPADGIYEKGQKISLSTLDGADIYYTIDGSEPDSSSLKYDNEKKISLENEMVMKTVSIKKGLKPSDVKSYEYKVRAGSGNLTIAETQGESHVSPYVDKYVKNVSGIVTAIVKDRYDVGFYMQSIDPDENPKTSEAIYVDAKKNKIDIDEIYTGSIVLAEGYVREVLNGYEGGLDVTELELKKVRTLSTGNHLPEPVIIGKNGVMPPTAIIENDGFESFDPDEDALDFYESLESMLVKVENPVIVGADERYGEISVLADNGEASSEKRSKDMGIVATATNLNPEIIHIDDVIVPLSGKDKKFIDKKLKFKVSDRLSGPVTGVMTYGFGKYKIYNVEKLPEIIPGNLEREVTKLVPGEDKLVIASYNVENFSTDKGSTPDEKVERIAESIKTNLKLPDIIGLIEVQDDDGQKDSGHTGAEKSIKRLTDEIEKISGVKYETMQIDPIDKKDGGAPGGNIRVAFIYRSDRVKPAQKPHGDATSAVSIENGDLTLNPGRISPNNDAFENTRKSLVAEFIFKGQKIFVIENHLSSKRGDAPDYGKEQPPVKKSEFRRHKQAQLVNDFVDEILKSDKNANIVVLGDMNDYEYSKTLDILEGEDKALENLFETKLPKNERYTYVYMGNSQVLDNALASTSISGKISLDPVGINAEFTEGYKRASDHDPVLVQIDLSKKKSGSAKKHKSHKSDDVKKEDAVKKSRMEKAYEKAEKIYGKGMKSKKDTGIKVDSKTSKKDRKIRISSEKFKDMNKKYMGVYVYDEDKNKLSYVPSRIDKKTGELKFNAKTDGEYVLMEYKQEFKDTKNHWANEYIETMASKHIVNGDQNGNFNPEGRIKRAEFAAMIVRSLGVEGQKELSFADVEDSAWYAEVLKAAVENQIISGGENFRPDDSITREEMAVMISRAMKLMDDVEIKAKDAGFKDMHNVSPWAEDAIREVYGQEIINGYESDGGYEFKPREDASRSEAIVMIERMLEQ